MSDEAATASASSVDLPDPGHAADDERAAAPRARGVEQRGDRRALGVPSGQHDGDPTGDSGPIRCQNPAISPA